MGEIWNIGKIVKNSCFFEKICYNVSCDCGRQHSAGIAQSVEHFTRNEGVVSSSLISSLYMTDGSPVSLEYEDAGLFLVCMDVVEGRQRKVVSLRAGTPSGDTTRAP